MIQVGMVSITINAPRLSPRNNNTIKPVSTAPMAPSSAKLFTALITYTDWSNTYDNFTSFGNNAWKRGIAFLRPCTTSQVEASADLVIGRYIDLLPLTSA